MARARNIKPAFFLNTELSENTPLERLAFIGMWTIADFKGCISFNPKKIKAQILPYDDCNMETIAINLDKSGFISIYSVQGKRYLKIINFEKHQNPHKNEREAGSELPDIDENDNSFNDLSNIQINPDKNGTARADSLIPLTDSLNADSLIPEPLIPSLVASLDKPAKPTKVKPEKNEILQAACRRTWQAYETAYFDRYGTEPVRNAKVNKQVISFVERIGFNESPLVASNYLNSNNSYYVGRGHSFDCLLSDAEKLRTEWATGKGMTTTRANQIDKTQSNHSAVAEAMKILQGDE
jgi:hypothetical protein